MISRSDADIIVASQNWLNNIIVGLNLCPFAKKEVQRQTIRYQLCHAGDLPAALQCLLDEVYLLDKEPQIETTLVIFPQAFSTFDDYLQLVDLATSLLDQSGYRGIYQLATFHPDYCFAGEAADDAANFTNRSPYPTLHLLRETSLERVLAIYSDPESIPTNNINKTRELGKARMQQLLAQCFPEHSE